MELLCFWDPYMSLLYLQRELVLCGGVHHVALLCFYSSDYNYIFLVATVEQDRIRDIWSESNRYLIFKGDVKYDIRA